MASAPTGTTALRAAVTGKASDIAKAAADAGKDLSPKDMVKHLLEQNKQVIRQALPKHMNPERLMRVAITSVTSNPSLLECYVPTLIGGIIQCSQMGLEPNTVLGHAYLIPFYNNDKRRKDCQVVIGYKGLIDLARRSGQIVSIAAHAVRENDEFDFEYGLEEKLRHIPDGDEAGEITHFYAVAHMKDGGHAFEVMTAREVMKIRDAAAIKNRAKRDESGDLIIKGPWRDHFEEMGRKTVIRRLSKYLPLSVEMATAVAFEDANARGEPQNLEGVLDGDYTIHGGDDTDTDPGSNQLTDRSSDAGGNGAGAAGASDVSKKDPTPAEIVADVKKLCAQAIESRDLPTSRLKLDEAKEFARGLKDPFKSNADLAIGEAEDELKARETK